MEQTQNPTMRDSTTNQQQRNRRLSMDNNLSHWGLKCIWLVQNLRPRFCCCENTQKNVKLARRLPNYFNVSSQRNNLIKLTHSDETKKRTHDSQKIRAKETLKLSHGAGTSVTGEHYADVIKQLRVTLKTNIETIFQSVSCFVMLSCTSVCWCLVVNLLGTGWPLGSRLWCIIVTFSLSYWYPGSGVMLDCIDSWSLPSFFFCY